MICLKLWSTLLTERAQNTVLTVLSTYLLPLSIALVHESTSGVIKMRKAKVGVEMERRNFIKTAGTVLAASPWLSSLAQAQSFT